MNKWKFTFLTKFDFLSCPIKALTLDEDVIQLGLIRQRQIKFYEKVQHLLLVTIKSNRKGETCRNLIVTLVWKLT